MVMARVFVCVIIKLPMATKTKNFDGIKKIKTRKSKVKVKPKRALLPGLILDGIKGSKFKRPAKKPPVNAVWVKAGTKARTVAKLRPRVVRKFHPPGFFSRHLAVIMVSGLLMSFAFGVWYEWKTSTSSAGDTSTAAASLSAAASNPIPLAAAPVGLSAESSINSDALFNTPLELLKNYFASPPSPDQPDALAMRKTQLHQFLKDRNSPLEPEADLIAEQDHWKLILAISFAESSLGKRCYYNNCSGIGGSDIKTYHSLTAWIIDFNHLLESRYKDKTLEQMCGVYVQPCNPNWLLATRQILTALDDQSIN